MNQDPRNSIGDNNSPSKKDSVKTQREEFSQVIKSRKISQISSLFNNQEFKSYSAKDHNFILKTIKEEKINLVQNYKSERPQNKSSLSRQDLTLQHKALSSLEKNVSINRNIHHIENKIQNALLLHPPKSNFSENTLSEKIKLALQDLITTIQKLFTSKSHENAKLLETIKNNVKKYSISHTQESTKISQPSTNKISKNKTGEQEI